MRWPTALLVYAIIWWLVVFMVLPWGNQPIDAADVARGHMAGSPKKPHLLLKFAITTVVAGIIFAIFYWVHEAGLIRIRL